MNWTIMQTYSLSQEKSFEMICNQIFENWCKENYTSEILSFNVVNGAGGDGGVESYVALQNGDIIAVQAKFFLSSIDSSKIFQIKNSITTAIKIRPNITRYIVCVPRDLSSLTGKGENTEESRWEKLKNKIAKKHPNICIELWNDSKITSELEKPNNAGVFRFWFKKSELSSEIIYNSFEKSKSTWLQTKYVPDLNTCGDIDHCFELYLGNKELYEKNERLLESTCETCRDFIEAADELLEICPKSNTLIKKLISEAKQRINKIISASEMIQQWLLNDSICIDNIVRSDLRYNFDILISQIDKNHDLREFHSHKSSVIKSLKKLSTIDFSELFYMIDYARKKKSLLFLGDPGTGKTHGVSAFAKKILESNLHIPILIQAKSFFIDKTWKNIVVDTLGLSNTWSDDELWQGMVSLVNRNRFLEDNLSTKIKIIPKVIIIVDGLDEVVDSETWVNRIKEANKIIAKYPQIRFCFTSRPFVFYSVDCAILKRISPSGDVPAYRLFDTYIKTYKITAKNSGWLKYAITTPLALKLFCELNQNKHIDFCDYAEVTIPELWRKKIELIEKEYALKESVSMKNQFVLKAIRKLSVMFSNSVSIEHDTLSKSLCEECRINNNQVDTLIQHLDNYGVINCYCKRGSGIETDTYLYSIGIQGYFDYAMAISILNNYSHPCEIDFSKYKKLQINVLYGLGALSIQKYDYMITQNDSFSNIYSSHIFKEIQIYSLLHTKHKSAEQYVDQVKSMMYENADSLITIVNQLVLPLARHYEHPLGVLLLDDFLNSFEKPAKRDIVWSIRWKPSMGYDDRWCHERELNLNTEEHKLQSEDRYNGLPTVYAWALSSNDNSLRNKYRVVLMKWAKQAPKEFYKLFLKFAMVNDPQIRSDIFSILMCCIYTVADNDLVHKASEWICNNILNKDKIDENRDIAIRYYSIAIIKKANSLGKITDEDMMNYLPPYHCDNYSISLNKNALEGTRLGGYSAISYDLSRYVLIDRMDAAIGFSKKKYNTIISNISREKPDYNGISSDQFILSAAYAFLLDMGWNEEEFNYRQAGDPSNNVDIAIQLSYLPLTHGEMSPVMTICEKYIWQAKKYILGFISDRVLLGEDDEGITDYGEIEDFIIPDQENLRIYPDNIPINNPWHFPEKDKFINDNKNSSVKDIIEDVKNLKKIDWHKWIFFNNDGRYNIAGEKLLALNMFLCLIGKSGIERNLFLNSIVVDKNDLLNFVNSIIQSYGNTDLPKDIYNPNSWFGCIDTSCYITPKEICWFPWKKHYDGSYSEYFNDFKIFSAVDKCYYSINGKELKCKVPSLVIREMLGITDTDGFLYFDNNKKVKGEFILAGEVWGTYQEYLLVDANELLTKLSDANKTILWLFREFDINAPKSREKFGDFFAEYDKTYVGYLYEGEFIVKQIYSKFNSKEKIKRI